MNNTAQKGLKPFIIKIAVLAMSICYVFGPSHDEVNKLLHFFSHQLEIPNTILEHSNFNHLEYNDKHYHKNKEKVVHNHKILDLIDNILEATNTDNDSKNSEITVQKIEKHIRTKEDFKIQNEFLPTIYKNVFIHTTQKTQNGFIQEITQPPQFI